MAAIMGYKRFVFLILLCSVGFFLACSLSGCLRKKTITYIPKEKRGRLVTVAPAPKSVKTSESSLKNHYDSWKGVRYVLGGTSHTGVDCSGFTLLTYRKLYDLELPRTVNEQVRLGSKVAKKNLQPGDLVFFKTGFRSKHVGIYYERDLFMHASETRGVALSSLNASYWKKRYYLAKRY